MQAILDDEASAERVAYTLDNPRKARLVADPEEWPGLALCFGLIESEQVPFEYFDYAAWRKARRPDDKSPFFRVATVKISPLPHGAHRSAEEYAGDVRSWLARQLAAEEPESGQSGKRAAKRSGYLGVEAVLKASIDQRPMNPKFSKRPYGFGSPLPLSSSPPDQGGGLRDAAPSTSLKSRLARNSRVEITLGT